MNLSFLLSAAILFIFSACNSQSQKVRVDQPDPILPGIYQMATILNSANDKSVAVVSNHTGLIDNTHLVDTLLSRGINVAKVFAPEHGFRGDRSDGAKIDDSRDQKTGLPIHSLYGSKKKPAKSDLDGIDLIIFDIQDVGARFYTYLSTLHYVMEAAAESDISVMVLDRPNPNGFYLDGPVMDSCCTSFVGLHPVPIVYGMTIGEYAKMINGEGWLKNKVMCQLEVVPCSNYNHSLLYELPVKPSPNLPDMASIYLYPSLCLFEGTRVSVGRGTDTPFKVIGEPSNSRGSFSFVPQSIPGASLSPKHMGDTCTGYDLSAAIDIQNPPDYLDFGWLTQMYKESENKSDFFNKNGYFEKLAGTKELRHQIISMQDLEIIKNSWSEELIKFKEIRKKYLIYPE